MSKISDLKYKVEFILKDSIAARNDDHCLIWALWREFYYIGQSINYETFVTLPNVDAITRLRRTIQNDEKKYVPTSEKVALARDWKIDEWRIALGYKLDIDAYAKKPKEGLLF